MQVKQLLSSPSGSRNAKLCQRLPILKSQTLGQGPQDLPSRPQLTEPRAACNPWAANPRAGGKLVVWYRGAGPGPLESKLRKTKGTRATGCPDPQECVGGSTGKAESKSRLHGSKKQKAEMSGITGCHRHSASGSASFTALALAGPAHLLTAASLTPSTRCQALRSALSQVFPNLAPLRQRYPSSSFAGKDTRPRW